MQENWTREREREKNISSVQLKPVWAFSPNNSASTQQLWVHWKYWVLFQCIVLLVLLFTTIVFKKKITCSCHSPTRKCSSLSSSAATAAFLSKSINLSGQLLLFPCSNLSFLLSFNRGRAVPRIGVPNWQLLLFNWPVWQLFQLINACLLLSTLSVLHNKAVVYYHWLTIWAQFFSCPVRPKGRWQCTTANTHTKLKKSSAQKEKIIKQHKNHDSTATLRKLNWVYLPLFVKAIRLRAHVDVNIPLVFSFMCVKLLICSKHNKNRRFLVGFVLFLRHMFKDKAQSFLPTFSLSSLPVAAITCSTD